MNKTSVRGTCGRRFSATRGALKLVFAVLATAGIPAAASQQSRHHLSVDHSIYPWSSLVKLFNGVGGSCTGAVVGRDRILTAGHCVYAFRTRRFLPPEALHVLLGYDRGDYRIHARVARYRLGPDYDPEAERRTAASDWAVLDLAEPLPADVRPLKLSDRSDAVEGKIMLAGFARDRAYVLTADDDCSVTGMVEAGRLIAHDCMIQPGDSGAPLLRRDRPGGEATIVGVAIGIWSLGSNRTGIAAPLPANVLTQGDGPP